MIRDARTFFKAMSLGFLLPAAVLGAGVAWLNDQSPASAPIAATDASEIPSLALTSAGSPSVGTASHQPLTGPAPAVVAMAPGGLGESSRTELAVKIQRELRRLGCMQDAIDGVWSEATTIAARTFVQYRQLGVAADTPSNLLLLMLEADRSNQCSRSTVEASKAPTVAASSAVLTTTSSGTVGDGPAAVAAPGTPAPAASASDAPNAPKRSSQANGAATGKSDRQSTFSILHGNAP